MIENMIEYCAFVTLVMNCRDPWRREYLNLLNNPKYF